MSGIEIKFWNTEKKRYESDNKKLYFVNSDNMVVVHIGFAEIRSCSKIEPHFYKDGERIA